MSTALMPARFSHRLAHLVGPRLGAEDPDLQRVSRGSMPWASISSRIARKYDGVTMMTRGPKSTISWTWRSVMPPLIGTTVQPSRSAP